MAAAETAQSKRTSLEVLSTGNLTVHVPDLSGSSTNLRNVADAILQKSPRSSVFYGLLI